MNTAYKVQINMADPGQRADWQDCEGTHQTQAQAEAAIEWMKQEYGDTIEFRVGSTPIDQ